MSTETAPRHHNVIGRRALASFRPRAVRLADLADDYWAARKAGDSNRVAAIDAAMDQVAAERDAWEHETDTLRKLADHWDLDFKPETHSAPGVAATFCGWYGHVDNDGAHAMTLLTALHQAGVIRRDDYMATLDGPDCTYAWVTMGEFDGQWYAISYTEGDFRIEGRQGHPMDHGLSRLAVSLRDEAVRDGHDFVTPWEDTVREWLARMHPTFTRAQIADHLAKYVADDGISYGAAR